MVAELPTDGSAASAAPVTARTVPTDNLRFMPRPLTMMNKPY